VPIRAENRARYPAEWPIISLWVRVCACWRCEWCNAANGKLHPVTGSRVVLTVAHLDHQPENVAPSNLAALCQRCHNRYDAVTRAAGVAARRRAALAVDDLFSASWTTPVGQQLDSPAKPPLSL
jgi:hypothetical protein